MQDGSVSVGQLVASREQVAPSVRVKDVAERFFQEQNLDAIAVVDCREPVALVARSKLLFSLFRRFGFELYERKPILRIADTEPLLVHEGESIDVALDKALSRPFQDIYDDIVVVDDNSFFVGLLSVKGIVIEQSNALANSMVQKELANERAKELEKVSKIKSQFIANVTHELQGPSKRHHRACRPYEDILRKGLYRTGKRQAFSPAFKRGKPQGYHHKHP